MDFICFKIKIRMYLFFTSDNNITDNKKGGNIMQYSRVEICGVDTSKLTVLKESEKIELLKKAHNGDSAARDKLIKCNLRLVLSAVQKFSSRGENPDDLFQVGCIGLIKAIDRFNLDIDVKFSTYAVPMILGELRRFLRDNGQLRVSRSIRDTAYHAMRVKEKLQMKLQREPKIEEIAAEMKLPKEEIVIALESIVDPLSLSEPVFSDGGDTIYVEDQIGDKNDDKSWLEGIMLRDAMQKLGKREKQILYLRFLMGKTQVEVAKQIGISQAQVSRLEKNAIKSIRTVTV